MHINISKVNFKSISINIAKVDFGMYDSGGVAEYYGMYITPADASAISVTPNDSYYTLHGKYLKYSLNGKKWKDWNGSVVVKPEQKMYLKGEDDYVWNVDTSGKLITSSGYYNVGGDISSLTNEIVDVKNETFRFLFEDDSYIKDASNLILPATTLANSCYGSMFNGCTSLTTAPALHATTLAESCYSNMFSGCTSLTTAPELPAATLTPYCYYYMFNGCTALTTAPELPATTLAEACYSYMFSGCTALTTATELNATTLTTFCYANMFNGCTSLTTAPELNATTLSYNCYYHMFEGCTSLTTAPELNATKLLDNCYRGMFSGCSKLNNITMLATDISASGCLDNWVNGVASTGTFTKAASMTSLPTGVNGIPEGWTVADYTDYMTLYALGDGEITITIPAAINSSYATSLSYSKDKSTWNETIIDNTAQTINIPVTSGENVYLKGIAKKLFSNGSYVGLKINSSADINASGNIMSLLYGDDYKDKVAFPSGSSYTLYGLFKNNIHLINAKDLILPATTLASYCYQYMFEGCSSLTTAPELPATTLADYCYTGMFYGCSSLTTAPELPATTLASYCYQYMFKGCSSLTTATELPATKFASYCYESMFENCTSLTTAPALKSKNLYDGCYSNMFKGCTSLTNAPALPATTLSYECYSEMLSGCTALTTAPELHATTLVSRCYQYMFYGCTSLNNITMLATDISARYCMNDWVYGVSSTGTFTKAAEMTALPTGVNGIPSGWTVVDYGAQPTFYGIRGTANVTSTTLTGAISFNDTKYDVHVDENGKWEIEYNDPIYTSSNARSLCNSRNITSIDLRNTIWATRSQTNKDTFNNLFFDGAVSNLQDVYFDFTGQDTNDMCLESGIFSALTNCRIHGLGTLNWNGEIDVNNTTSKHVFSLREFNRNGIIGTLDLRGIDTTSITDQDVSSIHQTALSFDWTYGYWYIFPNNVYCDTIIVGSLEIQTDYFTAWYGPSSHCKTLYCTSPTPPSLSRTGAHGLTCYNWLRNLSSLQNIYVPVGCLEAYTNAPEWSTKASIMSEKEAPDPLSI